MSCIFSKDYAHKRSWQVKFESERNRQGQVNDPQLVVVCSNHLRNCNTLRNTLHHTARAQAQNIANPHLETRKVVFVCIYTLYCALALSTARVHTDFIATHYNTLQQTATNRNSLPNAATHCNTTSSRTQKQTEQSHRRKHKRNTTQHTATYCNTPLTGKPRDLLVPDSCGTGATTQLQHHNALPNTATHCNILRRTATQRPLEHRCKWNSTNAAAALIRTETHCNILQRAATQHPLEHWS